MTSEKGRAFLFFFPKHSFYCSVCQSWACICKAAFSPWILWAWVGKKAVPGVGFCLITGKAELLQFLCSFSKRWGFFELLFFFSFTTFYLGTQQKAVTQFHPFSGAHVPHIFTSGKWRCIFTVHGNQCLCFDALTFSECLGAGALLKCSL